MKKFIWVHNGKEVKMGVKLTVTISTAYGEIPLYHITVNEKNIQGLIEDGVIQEVNIEPPTIDFFLKHLADRCHWVINTLTIYLRGIEELNPMAIFSIILKEIAIVFDEKYQDHISNSKKIYIISSIDGEIKEIKDPSKIKSFRNFAAFRTLEEAIQAKEILKNYWEKLFGKDGK